MFCRRDGHRRDDTACPAAHESIVRKEVTTEIERVDAEVSREVVDVDVREEKESG
jgi:hypothetical protein